MTDSFAGDSVRRFSFATIGGQYAVFLASIQGSLDLTAYDSTTFVVGTTYSVTSGATDLANQVSTLFTGAAGATFILELRPGSVAARATFQFRVYRVNPDPEHAAARFAFGDTVAGENLETIVDADNFVVAAQAGQEVVAVAQPLGGPAYGVLSLTGRDGSNSLGGMFATPGPPTATTGRMRLPAGGDYRFELRTLSSGGSRYSGPYRFWSYLINRAPELIASAAPVGIPVTGETINRAGDVDEFSLAAAAGAEFNAFFNAGRRFILEVASGSGAGFVAVAPEPGDTGLFQRATGRFTVPAGPASIVRIGNDGTAIADTGAYQFFLYPINRAPESRPAAVALGDTISGEAIDLAGDIDEFTFSGVAGGMYNVLFQAASGSSDEVLRLEALDTAGVVLGVTTSGGTDSSLFQRSLGRFTTAVNGTYRLRVRGETDRTNRDVGPYRLVLYQINPLPETAPVDLPFGDSVLVEGIDVPGDVDEFRVFVPDSSGGSVMAEIEVAADVGDAFAADVFDSTGLRQGGTRTWGPGGPGLSERMSLAPGTHTLRVEGYNTASLLRTPYRLRFYRFKFGAEAVSDTVAIGDTVTGEAIDPINDFDLFHFFAARGQHFNIAFQGTGDSVIGSFRLLVEPYQTPLITPTRADSLGATRSMRIDVRLSGWQRLSIERADGNPVEVRGPYRFALTAVGTGPEIVPAGLVPGDSITGEGLDFLGDWDEYTITGSPGQWLTVVGHQLGGNGYTEVAAFDSATGDTVSSIPLQGIMRATPRFQLPPSGNLQFAAYERRGGLFGSLTEVCADPVCGTMYRQVGAYRLKVVPINLLPETASATITRGDTARESLTIGDVDEFLYTGTAGEPLRGTFGVEAPPVPDGQYIWFEFIDPATGTSIAPKFGLFGTHTTDFTLPASGRMLVRVDGSGTFGDEIATGPYRLVFVTPGGN